ncbi:alanyl-tRNA editing protein [Candidatus Persebacteraceae bacterium Df01]|jgi:misacylated tRNA(Ala) deacylase|uniref:Alanine--tRNA ligase n=1 Tax=Candidatus Doriopsillibacter californiensis TaxID=2970740 RepID=A0ABT7QKA2_9GAMM|nr:alanyl-tRNA editing protein [Candidatus Persebacteraceae bacterium Df01]
MTLYWDEPYRRDICTVITQVETATDGIKITCNQTVFYPHGGGQPGDTGQLIINGHTFKIINTTREREHNIIWHHLQGDVAPAVGDMASLILDWQRRHQLMRTHTAMHLLCAAVNAPVTGSNISGPLRGRIDFDNDGTTDKMALEEKINNWVHADVPVTTRWVDEKELDDNPSLVRTLSVSPPRGSGTIRLVEIAGIDLQACGGTHVARTEEIGTARVIKIENKGRINHRVIVELTD